MHLTKCTHLFALICCTVEEEAAGAFTPLGTLLHSDSGDAGEVLEIRHFIANSPEATVLVNRLQVPRNPPPLCLGSQEVQIESTFQEVEIKSTFLENDLFMNPKGLSSSPKISSSDDCTGRRL